MTVDPTAIPWLPLAATSEPVGEDGDRFAATTFIQRVATTGEIAPPAADCNAGTAGTVDEVPYTAEDPAGHQSTFSQTLADVAPEEWGGIAVRRERAG